MSLQDKEQYLSTTKELIKQGINNLGENLTNQSTFRSYKTGLDNVYDDMPKVTAEGTELTIQNTRKGRMNIGLKGNTSQISTTGKNLLVNNVTDYSYNGITYTINFDKSVTINGTATGQSNLYFVGTSSLYVDLGLSAGKYTLSGCSNSSSSKYILYCVVKHTDETTTSYSQTNSAQIIDILEGDTFRIFIRTVSGAVVNNEIVYPQLEAGETVTDYEPYTNGASPNPDYPQPIHKVTGNNTISIGSNNHSINLGNDEYYNINDFADEIFKNIPTNPHYDNMLIEGAWYKYSNNKKKIFNGSEDWNYTSGVFLLSNITDYKLSTTNICLCSHYKTQNCVTATSQINDKCVTFRNDASTRRFYIKDSSFSNLEDFKASLNSNNVTLIYRLNTPTTTQITDEILIAQLEAIYNAMSTTGTTTISQTNADLPFIISASALKSYPTGTINITENGNNIDVSLYDNANVNVQPALQSKQVNITENGTTTVTPDTGYDGLSGVAVTVDVSGSVVVIPNGIKFGDTISTATNYDWLADVDTSNIQDMNRMFYRCSQAISIPSFDTSGVTSMERAFEGCSNLVNIGILDTHSITGQWGLNGTFASCPNLSDSSLNNIMAMCIQATQVQFQKTLAWVGLSSTQATTCQSLSNWDAFVAAGWTTGY